MLSDMTRASSTGKDFRDLAQGFGVCTIAVLVLYLFSGMSAINLRETHLAFLMTILTVSCAYYVTSAFVSSAKRFCSLIAAVPVFPISRHLRPVILIAFTEYPSCEVFYLDNY